MTGSVAALRGAANPFEDGTVAGLLDTLAARYPAREAIVFGGERISFADLARRSRVMAAGLATLGIARGDRVAIWLPSRPAWYVLQHACARLGAVCVALNPRYRSHELGYILEQSGATALVVTDHLGPTDYLEILDQVLPELRRAVPGELEARACPALRHVVVDAEDPYPGCHRLADLVDAGRDPDAVPASGPGPDDVFTLLYTSGTTSFPKGAMISHRNCVPHAYACGRVLGLTPDDRVLHALPAAGTWGGVNIPLTTWSHGAALVLMDVFDPGRALDLVERERCTVWNAVDQMARAVLDHPALDRTDRRSLRTGGFAATSGGGHGLFEAVVERIGIRLAYQPYGMTEVNAMALVHDLDEPADLRAVPGIHPMPGLEVRIVRPESGAPCAADEEGELQFRGPRVTGGYFRKPEETAAAFTEDGWFRSGDLGVRTREDHVVFRGRLREVLRISHHMVAPGEIEAFLMSHPAVDQAFVVGIPDRETNEAAAAYVVLARGARLTEDELRGWCRGRIASFKVPRMIRFVADVPRTPGPHGDKVQRGRLRDLAIAEIGAAAPGSRPPAPAGRSTA
jgi:fatty-acyl-CoA synthase